ncbi:uncharacterized protein LOC18437921 isoform X1 [Amborella trichopoda]|uniref:uncharacterized protein LOC18437921 isoform X1 n=1 Tax=Amborella trichopoda TaxID=13333 RepID=UPI0009BFA1A5|nr:uncharacterized protein LOC18437921 isoform X1 [Amborella trichopoda]|eukprot:XP_020525053.1 uncharacterized protein LOC18437921 isoform X1 [Amborella trichopoda]
MGTLTRSSTKVFWVGCRVSRPWSTGHGFRAFERPVIHLFTSKKIHRLSIHVSQKLMCSSVSCSSEPEVNVDPVAPSQSAVHVRFILQKECMFGQQFFIVGEHPSLGSWDPTAALLMDWSDGHVWTTDLEVPAGTTLLYKFILKGKLGEIEWQPGPDRVVKTWGTSSTIVISESWETAELQTITEETQLQKISEEPKLEKTTKPKLQKITETSQLHNINEEPSKCLNEKSKFAEHPHTSSKAEPVESDLSAITPDMLNPEVPILIPGLASPSKLVTEEAVSNEAQLDQAKSHVINPNDGAIDDFPKLIGEQELQTSNKTLDQEEKETPQSGPGVKLSFTEGRETAASTTEKSEPAASTEDSEPAPDDLLKNDLAWGTKTLSKLFWRLGFCKE